MAAAAEEVAREREAEVPAEMAEVAGVAVVAAQELVAETETVSAPAEQVRSRR